MKFLFLEGKKAEEIYYGISVTLGEKILSYSTVINWVSRFKTGHFSTKGEDHPGGPLVVSVSENVDAVRSMILEDRRMSARKIAKNLVTSSARVGFITYDVLDVGKLCAKRAPKWLNVDQKRVVTSRAIREHFRWNTAVSWLSVWQ
jgi:hypothetical protein